MQMLVDTGSMYIVLDPKTIEQLNLMETPYVVSFVLADKRVAKVRLFVAEVEVKGRRGPAFIAQLETPTPLLAVYSLETLGFKVDPRSGELQEISPEGGYLLAAASSTDFRREVRGQGFERRSMAETGGGSLGEAHGFHGFHEFHGFQSCRPLVEIPRAPLRIRHASSAAKPRIRMAAI